MMVEIWGWTNFFERLAVFLQEAERRDGHANHQYAEFAIDKLQFAHQNLTRILQHLNSSISAASQDNMILLSYTSQITELLDLIRTLSTNWQRYTDELQARPEAIYHLQVVRSLSPGRPKFQISQNQLEYLASLSFTWSEVARILGVSRMTIYRRRVEFGMMDNETGRSLTDQELRSYIITLRRDLPQVGESMVFGRIRSEGYTVPRQQIRHAIRDTDPLNTALRWRGDEAYRRPYSVPGPNALWHIGTYIVYLSTVYL